MAFFEDTRTTCPLTTGPDHLNRLVNPFLNLTIQISKNQPFSLSWHLNDNLKTETPINHYFRFEWRSGSERKEDWFTKSISLNNNRLLIVYVNSDGLSSFIIILGNFGDESWICIFGLTHAGSWITMMNQKISNNPFKNSLSEPVHSTKEIILAL